MQSESRAFRWFIILFILGILEVIYFYPNLPTRVATHFALNGEPNGWSTKTAYLFFTIGMNVFMLLVFWGLAVLFPKMPESTMNIPHKEYWLAPERREQTIRDMQEMMYTIGSLTFGLLLFMHYIIYQENLHPSEYSEFSFWLVMGVWLVLLFYYIIRMMRRYRLPKEPDHPDRRSGEHSFNIKRH